MISELIDDLLREAPVPALRVELAIDEALRGELSDAQLAGLLVALRSKRPTPELLARAAKSVRAHQLPFPNLKRPCIDTCGTGGDGAKTFNISTAVALVVAAAGGCVAKHGNRSVSSNSGSADVLEALGVPIDLEPHEAQAQLREHGFAFLFAPRYHPALARVANVRRQLGVRTLFNLLGPLLNPTGAANQLIGVYDPGLTQCVAEALALLGSERALVVHCDGLDELGLHSQTHGHFLERGLVTELVVDSQKLGFASAPVGDLIVEGARESARMIEQVLGGERGAAADIIALNAGAALFVGELADSIEDGCEQARAILQSGTALQLLERLRRLA